MDKLIYFEVFNFINMAIKREKQIKGYSRAKKNELINAFNPNCIDLYDNGENYKDRIKKKKRKILLLPIKKIN